jgi:hypothetical protein
MLLPRIKMNVAFMEYENPIQKINILINKKEELINIID